MHLIFWAAVGAAIGGIAGRLSAACRLQTVVLSVLGLVGATAGASMASGSDDGTAAPVLEFGVGAAAVGGALALIALPLLRCRRGPR